MRQWHVAFFFDFDVGTYTVIEDKQWSHYVMFTQLSDYHFLFNILLIIISTLQIAVSNESALNEQVDLSLTTSLAKYTNHISLQDDSPPLSHESSESDEVSFIDKILSFMINNLNKITSFLILILSSVNISLISAVYFLYILYFILYPDRVKERNSLSVRLLLILSYIHLLGFVSFQIPYFQESLVCINDYCIFIFQTIGLTKLVMADYDGAPQCYPIGGQSTELVPCYHPLSIHGMLPVMAIVVIVYLQLMITSSSTYDVVERSMQNETVKAQKQKESILNQLEIEYQNRQESNYFVGS